jgi:4-amino-4-deoxy-L-arabinose transferase-like glycosyltransferase
MLILAGSLTLHLCVLFTSQAHVDGDEAVVGIMAKHIITKSERPIFFYGQSYGGGAAIEAYLAAIPFSLFGVSSLSFKMVALLLWSVTLLFTYLFCLRYFGFKAAVFSSLILATATPLIEWHLKMRGGYAALPLLSILLFFVFTGIARGNGKSKAGFLLLGMLAGLAYYNSELVLSLFWTLFMASFYWPHVFWRGKSILLSFTGFLVGCVPLIYYNFAHGFSNLKHLLSIDAQGIGLRTIHNVLLLFTKHLPAFFVGRNVDQFVTIVPVAAYIEYFIYICVLTYVIIKHGRPLLKPVKTPLSKNKTGQKYDPPPIQSIILLFVFAHLLMYLVSGVASPSPRYLLPLFPFIAILAGITVVELRHSNHRIINLSGVAVFCSLVGLGIFNHLTYLGPAVVNDDVVLADGRRVNRQTSGETMPAIIRYLKESGITYARSTYFVQWRLIFESNEEIIASSNGLHPGARRYPSYDEQVSSAKNVATIFHNEDFQLKKFLNSKHGREFSMKVIDDYHVFVPRPN